MKKITKNSEFVKFNSLFISSTNRIKNNNKQLFVVEEKSDVKTKIKERKGEKI